MDDIWTLRSGRDSLTQFSFVQLIDIHKVIN